MSTSSIEKVVLDGKTIFLNSSVIIESLNRMNETFLPLPVSYRVQKLIKTMQEPLKQVNTIKIDLFKLYGKETEPGIYSLDGDNEAQEKFTRDFNEMTADIKTEFNVLTINLSDPTTYGAAAVFMPKDISILMDLGLIKIIE